MVSTDDSSADRDATAAADANTTPDETRLDEDGAALAGAQGGLRSRTEDILRDADQAVADFKARHNAFLAGDNGV